MVPVLKQFMLLFHGDQSGIFQKDDKVIIEKKGNIKILLYRSFF
jgi:hypothetical protein